MDGRIRSLDLGAVLIGLAGSGVLLNDDQITKFVGKIRENGVDPTMLSVTYHEFCGACQTFLDKNPNDLRTVDQVAKWSAERLARALESKQPIKSIGWSDKVDIKISADPHHHTEKTVVIDGTGKLDYRAIDQNGFFISARYSPDVWWMNTELSVALNIAIDEHGLGRAFFSANPMQIYIIGDGATDQYSSIKLAKAYSPTLSQFSDFIQVHTLDL